MLEKQRNIDPMIKRSLKGKGDQRQIRLKKNGETITKRMERKRAQENIP
jgi:hypothetical protein